MMSRTATLLRFLICGLIATAIFVVGGGWLVHSYLGHKPKAVIGLQVVRGIELIHAIPGVKEASRNVKKNDSAKLVPGLVQVAFTVGEDGRAHNIRVLRATPEGMYEQAARTVIAARHFDPPQSAQAAAKQHTEIVHFSSPSKDSPGRSATAPQPDDGG
ncbi:MAG: energy transducer TonB [Gammaproteobacteria bacterium]|nr:energy transducer TonB [Gammaproteobacteria bacterium]